MFNDLSSIFYFWLTLLIIGVVFLPLTTKVFSFFADSGYIFAKILGLAIVSYLIWLAGSLHLLPFSSFGSWLIILLLAVVNLVLIKKSPQSFFQKIKNSWKIIAFEEFLFLGAFLFWAYIRAHEPSIHGLEKFMDFGFINSILRSEFFPPKDLWLTPESINYYYFGHLVTAILTKLSGIPSEITFNFMLATLFGLTFTGAFSIGLNLFNFHLRGVHSATSEVSKAQAVGDARGGPPSSARSAARTSDGGEARQDPPPKKLFRASVVAGFLSGFLVALGGNLHTIYAFTRGFDKYWYPDATRFIPYTIHEFPSYSWVVSDLHGHVLDIPFVLLTIAILISIVLRTTDSGGPLVQNSKFKVQNYSLKLKILKLFIFNFSLLTLLLAFLLAVMYMTNAWDGIIYFGLTSLVILYLGWRRFSSSVTSNNTNTTNVQYYQSIKNDGLKIKNCLSIGNYWYLLVLIGIIFFGFFLFSLPFNRAFEPFVSGLGFVRDRSPLYTLAILWGFFYFFVASFLVFLWKTNSKHQTLNSKQAQNTKFQIQNKRSFGHLNFGHWNLFSLPAGKAGISDFGFRNLAPTDVFVLLLILLSTLLLIFPEVAYVKDIYPLHYRANTMFKLGYQAFIMLSLSSAYIFMRILTSGKNLLVLLFFCSSVLLFTPVAIYPYFAIKSYYNSLKTSQGVNGLSWLKNQYPSDYQTIQWLRQNVKGQPVILEAVGESYTDYARVSSFTGLPTVLGWPVHEWLWRGSYDEAGRRDAEVRQVYETTNLGLTRAFLEKYRVEYVFVGALERQKYPAADFTKWDNLGEVVFQSGQTIVYQASNF